MVSLGNESSQSGRHSRYSGGSFFGGEDMNASDEELLIDHLPLSHDADPPFRKIRTVWAIILLKILFVLLVLTSYLVPLFCDGNKCGTDPFSIVVYTHGAMWCLLLLIDRYLRHKHHVSRLQGYLEFYRKTRHMRRWPFTLNSGANALAVIVVRILDKYCSEANPCTNVTRENYLQILISVEVVIALPILVIYLYHTVKFNQTKAYPDVQQDDVLTSFVQSQSSDVGFSDENYVDQILEKQADMIRYLKQHNVQLGKRVMTLTSEMNNLKSQYVSKDMSGIIN